MQVSLVFAKSYVENPTANERFSTTIKVDLPSHIDRAHLIAARSHDPEQSSDKFPVGDIDAIIWEHKDFDRLLGQLLTYIDATFTDSEQRKAHKDIVKKIVRDNVHDVHARGIQTVDAHSKS